MCGVDRITHTPGFTPIGERKNFILFQPKGKNRSDATKQQNGKGEKRDASVESLRRRHHTLWQ